MKKIAAFVFTVFILFSFYIPASADWAVYATPFVDESSTYANIDMIVKARELRTIDEEIAQYLHNEKNPIDIKAAVINAIGWHYEKRQLVEKYIQLVYNKSLKSINLDNLSAHDLFCIGYLTALDGGGYGYEYFEAAPILKKTQKKMPGSFTVAIINALVEAKLVGVFDYPSEWSNSWEPIQAVYNDKSLELDMEYQARKIIFERTSYLSKDKVVNPFVVAVDPSFITVEVGKEYAAFIDGGEPPYKVESKPSEIDIKIEDNILTAKGLNAGKIEIKISNKNDSFVILPLQVNPASNDNELKSQKITQMILRVGHPYMILNGAPYAIDSDKSIVPILMDQRTLVPLRALVEGLGGTIDWIENESRVNLTIDSRLVELQIRNTKAYVNGKEEELAVVPRIINSRTYIPLRFVSESLGYTVEWEESNQKITISDDKQSTSINHQVSLSGYNLDHGKTLVAGDWIYYANEEDGGKLYKVRTDGTGKNKLSEYSPLYINVYDNWIYFRERDTGVFYKITLDGRATTRVIDDSPKGFVIWDDWIYYSNSNDLGKLYKVRTDGTNKTKLSDDIRISNIRIENDWVYYYLEDWESASLTYGDKQGYYKVKLDGSEHQKVGQSITIPGVINPIKKDTNFGKNIEIIHFNTLLSKGKKVFKGTQVLSHEGWTYYIDYSKQMKLFKMNSDGANRAILEDRFVAGFSIVDDWIYYTIKVDGEQLLNVDIYKMKLDGSSKTKLAEGSWISSFFIVEDSIIYLEESQAIKKDGEVIQKGTRKLNKISVDGTDKQVLTNTDIQVDDMQGEWIHYRFGGEYSFLNERIQKTNGSENIELNRDMSSNIQVQDAWVYYSNMNDDHKIYKIRTDGTYRTALPSEPVKKMFVSNEWIYYVTFTGDLYKIKTDGTGNSQLAQNVEHLIGSADDWVYYQNKLGDMVRIKSDATIPQLL